MFASPTLALMVSASLQGGCAVRADRDSIADRVTPLRTVAKQVSAEALLNCGVLLLMNSREMSGNSNDSFNLAESLSDFLLPISSESNFIWRIINIIADPPASHSIFLWLFLSH
ncbi:hypothetical protein FHW04_004160 [Pantoea sp. AN62]|uniref:hypothetical protein n=1 Tax=Pantoea TaxID=53335 RepID=UPI000A260368|nr:MULTISPECIES: hypothetical protein [Pantoea]MCQ5471987.1 hypothetical protein [Pantoea brenneri]MDU4747471.1 hypothetical protein [Pantoea sp.]ORM57977.1 hypothetical protein HA39_10650 [Pantoea brenneri]OXM20227.1 hypothetical protein CBI35_18560 [Pantoea sp. AV62]